LSLKQPDIYLKSAYVALKRRAISGRPWVRAVLRRQLAVPHAAMEDTRAMAEEWEKAHGRALHSSTCQLNVSAFGGTRCVQGVFKEAGGGGLGV
jgi:hypothetical protein